MTDVVQVVGVFRDRGQARMAVAEALRQGLDVPARDALVEDPTGVHVTVCTTAKPEDARRLLLEYGAYTASMSQPEAG